LNQIKANKVNKLNLKYKNQESTQLLSEGMNEFKKFDVQNDETERVSNDLIKDINEHDAIHTLFGCSTDLKGEILAHIWTYFGTTTELAQMKKVNKHFDHKIALQEIGHFKLIKSWFLNIYPIVTVIIKAKKMKNKFPISSYQNYLNIELKLIRSEFNIKI